MSLFDLAFIVAMLALLGAILFILINLVRGRTERAGKILRRVAIGAAGYFIVVVAFSLATPRQVVAIGSPQCFDDWCIAVSGARRVADTVHVDLTLSSRARGMTQGERDVRVYVIDNTGRRFEAMPNPALPSFSTQLPPGGTLSLTQDFVVPASATGLGVIVVHDWFPHCCIIGDRESLMHKQVVVKIDDR